MSGVPEARHPPSWLAWAVASQSLPGQPESGDLHVVKMLPNGALLSAIDGLGHGREAAGAAKIAAATLADHAGESISLLVEHCHKSLRGTRGAVMSLAVIDVRTATLTWLGVGNVEGVLVRRDAQGRVDRFDGADP